MDSRQNQNMIIKMSCVIISILKKWQLILLISLVFGIGTDMFKTITYTPQYMSSMSASLSSESNTSANLEDAKAYVKTLNYILNSQVVKNYVMDELETDSLDMKCSIVSVNNTNVIRVNVVSNTKREAYSSLKHISEWYINNMKQYRFTYGLNILESPSLNVNPINVNNHKTNFKTGFIYSLLIVVFIIGLSTYLKDTIKTPREIENKIDCRLFAKIPKENKKRAKKFWKKSKKAILITSLKTSFFYKESIKKLRKRVEESSAKHGYKTIMITSSLENEGKSSVAANLALSLAQNEHKVLLLDADIRKPSVHKIFELKTKKSINKYLKGSENWQDQIDFLPKSSLSVMCATQDIEHAEELVQSTRMKNLLQQLKEEFDYIIIDTSPAYYLNEPMLLNEIVDASLLVLKQNLATAKVINETISKLVSVKNNLIGGIYNASVIDLTKEQKVYGYRYGYNRYKRNERGQ